MTAFNLKDEVHIDIELLIEEMAEDALYRLDQMVEQGNRKQAWQMFQWRVSTPLGSRARYDDYRTYEQQRELYERWRRGKGINYDMPGSLHHG